MKQMKRRTALLLLAGLSGCAGGEDTSTTRGSNGPTSTAFQTDALEQFLPAETDGWEQLRTGAPGIGELGAEGGVEADYEKADGVEVRVNVIGWESAELAVAKGDDWADVGWQVVVPYRNLLFAGTTGTPDETLTPEHPPQVPGTVVPDSELAVRELLAQSKLFDAEYVAKHDVSE